MDPDELDLTGGPSALRSLILAPSNAEIYVTPNCTRTLDYFPLDTRIGQAIDEISTVLDANTRPHRPVLTWPLAVA